MSHMHSSVLSKTSESMLTSGLYEVMQRLKVGEELGHIFTAQRSSVGHRNI